MGTFQSPNNLTGPLSSLWAANYSSVAELIYFPFSTVVHSVVRIEQYCVLSRRGVPLGGHLVKMKPQLAAKNQIALHWEINKFFS